MLHTLLSLAVMRLGHDPAQVVSACRISAHLVSAQINRRRDVVMRACSTVTPRPVIGEESTCK